MDRKRFNEKGYWIARGVLPDARIEALLASIEAVASDETNGDGTRGGQRFGMRELFRRVPAVQNLAGSAEIATLARSALDGECAAVRALLFDKPPAANWNVAWRQDLAIAVRERRETAGFGPWSVKAGVIHVQPPVEVLNAMVTLRLHLDDCPADNGALRVVPGSHTAGRLSDDAMNRWIAETPAETIDARRGDVLVMRPLLLHASSRTERPRHRRVLHLEFAAGELPGGLEWHEVTGPNNAMK
jgi:hypothetical protein